MIRRISILLWLSTSLVVNLMAHPMPSSRVVLKVKKYTIEGQLQLPLGELQSAIGMGVNDHPNRLLERLGDTLRLYLKQHIRPRTFDGKAWHVALGDMDVQETKNPLTGDYRELTVDFAMQPPAGADLRNFFFDYDAIVHQVASHQVLIHVKEDWQQGIVTEDSTTHQLGVIALDVPSGKIPVFQVSLQEGSWWKGFANMVQLGIQHIAEGTDHLLFVLTLLMPAMLLAGRGRWERRLPLSQSVKNLVRIITAFTIGHSLTLFLASLQWVQLPAQPIEVVIALTILVSAVHTWRPLYARHEVWIAGVFGLVHGMAFAETLQVLSLTTPQLLLSILGFNIGIELMQLLVVLVAFPLLFFVSNTRYYPIIRTVVSVCLIGLSIWWLIERMGWR